MAITIVELSLINPLLDRHFRRSSIFWQKYSLPIFAFYGWVTTPPWAVRTNFDAFSAFGQIRAGRNFNTKDLPDVWGAFRSPESKINRGKRLELLIWIMDHQSYEECFADDESYSTNSPVSSSSRDDIEHRIGRNDILEATEENECVFDTEWALQRRYSLSSLLYSRFLLRLEYKMKSARG